MDKKGRILYRLSMALIIFTFLIFGYSGYLLFYPFVPAKLGGIPNAKDEILFPVKDSVIKQGEVVKYFVKYHKLMNVPAKATHMLVNHVQINFSDIYSFLPKGDYEVWNHDVIIPEFVSPGRYYIVVTWSYKVNPLRTITLTSRTQSFKVIAK